LLSVILYVSTFLDSSDWKREGIIFGCLLGAFVLVVALVALLYVRYEWHIRVYFKRLAILTRSRGTTTHRKFYLFFGNWILLAIARLYGVMSLRMLHFSRDVLPTKILTNNVQKSGDE